MRLPSEIEANPVVASMESVLILPANAKNVPSLETIESAFLKSDSIEIVFDAGAHGRAEDNVINVALELAIRIGEILVPPESVIRKYIFA